MDFRYWSNLFTMDAIMDIALSHQSGFLRAGADTVTLKRGSDEETGVSTLDSLRAGNRATEPVVWSATAFPLVKRLCLLVPSQRKQWGLAACWQQLVHERAEERLGLETAGQRPDDLFACLVRDSKEQALNLDRGEINAEVAHFCKHHRTDCGFRDCVDLMSNSGCGLGHDVHCAYPRHVLSGQES